MIFDIRIEILALTNIHLDIHDGILGVTSISVPGGLQDQPPAASRWPDIIFDARIEILTLTNLLLDIHDSISGDDLYNCTWPASRISLQRPPSGQILFLMQELKS